MRAHRDAPFYPIRSPILMHPIAISTIGTANSGLSAVQMRCADAHYLSRYTSQHLQP